MSAPKGVDLPAYRPPPSIGHEIGVMFGFIGFMVVVMVVYGFVWQAGQKRSVKKEEERRQRLRDQGVGMSEKSVDRDTGSSENDGRGY